MRRDQFLNPSGSCRRELLDQIIALNERHLYRLIREYVDCYHQDRVHDALEKDTPNRRPVERKPSAYATVTSMARAGGLHHRYSWRDAAWYTAAGHATVFVPDARRNQYWKRTDHLERPFDVRTQGERPVVVANGPCDAWPV